MYLQWYRNATNHCYVTEVCIYNGREMPLITVMLQRCVFTMVESITRDRGGKMAASTTVCVKMKSQARTSVKKGIYIIRSSAKYWCSGFFNSHFDDFEIIFVLSLIKKYRFEDFKL